MMETVNTETEKQIFTNAQVLEQLRAQVKPYIGIMAQSQFSTTCTKIENGLCKIPTVISFFAKFGYAGEWNAFYKLPEPPKTPKR